MSDQFGRNWHKVPSGWKCQERGREVQRVKCDFIKNKYHFDLIGVGSSNGSLQVVSSVNIWNEMTFDLWRLFRPLYSWQKYYFKYSGQQSSVRKLELLSFISVHNRRGPQKCTVRNITVKTKHPRECYICFECETKSEVVRILVIFFTDLRSATSIESSRRDLFNDMTEDRYVLKNYPILVSYPKEV